MIPVALHAEPAGFDAKVRQPGRRWLRRKKIPLKRKLKPNTKIGPYWRVCLDDLHSSYAGVCAYLCVYFERETGGATVDHYVPKSRQAGLAYEWDNYRLACSTMNSRKRDYTTVLDPFTLAADTFHLELVTGRIYPSPKLSRTAKARAKKTIERLKLDGEGRRGMRMRHYNDYREKDISERFLRKSSPFVWAEATRQGLL